MISVCIAIYNGAKYIREQLDSVLPQLSKDDEIIISDDYSTDNTLLFIKEYGDPRIKIFKNQGEKGVIDNFENSLVKAQGEYIFLCDQDDIWVQDKVEKSILALQTVDLVFSNALIINDNFEVKGMLYNHKDNCGFVRNLIKNRFIGATIAFRKSLLQVALPFPKKIPMHDQWLGLLAEYTGKTKFIDEPLIWYRRHQNNNSTTGKMSQYNIFQKIKFRTNILTALIQRIL